jgi:RNA polymerase sigma factor (sigma-70 family)
MQYPITPKTLIERLRDGDEIPWNEFYSTYAPIVRSLGSLKGLSFVECDELVQEVMLRFFKHSETFVFNPEIARFRTYFGRIVQWSIIDIFRRRQAGAPTETECPFQPEELPPPDKILDEALLAEWHRMLLNEALAELRGRVELQTYSAFELHGLQHRNPAEVAQMLKMNPARVYLAKSRCLNILREIFKRIGKDDPELGRLLNEN